MNVNEQSIERTQTRAIRFCSHYAIHIILLSVLVLAATLRFWNVSYDSTLTSETSGDAYNKFSEAKQLFREGVVHTEPHERYKLYNQPLFLIRSYAGIWHVLSFLGLDTSDQRMRVGFNGYMILFSLGTIVLVFVAGNIVFAQQWWALFASLLFATFPVNVVGSLYVKEDIPLMFWSTAAIVALLALTSTNRRVFYLWGGLCIGLAFATKYAGLLLVPVFLLAHLWISYAAGAGQRIKTLFSWQFFASMIIAVAAFIAFNPHVLTEWSDFCKGFVYQVDYASSGHHDGTIIFGLDYWWTFYLRYAIVPGLTLLPTILFLIGLSIAIIKRHRPLLLVSLTVLFIYFQFENSPSKPFPFFARYLHLIYPLMALLATFGLYELWRLLQTRSATRIVGVGIAVCTILFPLATSVLVAGGVQPDTRVVATRWINTHVPSGSSIVLGSRLYSPTQLDQKFKVRYEARVHLKSVEELRKQKYTYLVVNSFQYDRYPFSVHSSDSSRAAVEGYQRFARELELVLVIEPPFAVQTYGEHNPVIRIYRIPYVSSLKGNNIILTIKDNGKSFQNLDAPIA